MYSQEKEIVLRVVHHYALTGEASDVEVKVVCLPDNKTSFVEPNGSGGRSIMLDAFEVDGRRIWAAYSTHSGTVYLSSAVHA
jgi:hypothetical protein